MNKKTRRDALLALQHYVYDSIDYPDAENRVASEFRLSDKEVAQLRADYDQFDLTGEMPS